MLSLLAASRQLLPASCSLLPPVRRAHLTISFQPVVELTAYNKLLDTHHEIVADHSDVCQKLDDSRKEYAKALERAKDQEAAAESLRESLRRAQANSVALSQQTSLRGVIEIMAKTAVKSDPAFAHYLKQNKNPDVQECLRLIYDQDSSINSTKKSLKAHVQAMCKAVPVLEETIANIIRSKLYHTLSDCHHGASSTGRVIRQGGQQGWEPDEAAALSALLDFFYIDYEFMVDGEKRDPPPYRI